jgi:hypothetical protein
MKPNHSQALALAFIVADTYIRRDEHGRYCLNDLHKAAGGEERHAPSRWTRADSFHALVTELQLEAGDLVSKAGIPALETTQNPGSFAAATDAEMASNSPEMASLTSRVKPVAITEGRNGGTWVCIELVYAYAMWISPAFHLRVIRAYHALMTSGRLPRQDNTLAWRHNLTKLARQLVIDLERTASAFTRASLLDLLRNTHAELGVPTRDEALLPALPDPAAQEQTTVTAFWDAYHLMVAQGTALNHHRDPGLIAVNLVHVLAEASKQRIAMPPRALLLRALPGSTAPKFVAQKAVMSGLLNSATHCWVFMPEPVAATEPQLAY